MKKFISAVTAFAMAASMMVCFSVTASAEEVTEIKIVTDLVNALNNGGNYKVADGINELDCTGTNLEIKASNVAIDLNGVTVKTKSDGFFVKNTTKSVIVLENGTVDAGTGNYIFQLTSNEVNDVTLNNITGIAKQPMLVKNAAHNVAINHSNLTGGTTNGGVIHLTYGNCTVSDSVIKYSTASGVLLDATAANQASIILKDTIVQPTESATTGNGITVNSAKYGSIKIIGGTIEGKVYAIFYKGYETISIEEAQISTSDGWTINMERPVATSGDLLLLKKSTVNGGSKGAIYIKNAGISINGGTYRGNVSVNTGATGTITGGTFTADPTKYVDAEKCTVNYDNSVWTVIPAKVTATEEYNKTDIDGDGKATSVYKLTAQTTASSNKVKVTVDGSKEGSQTKEIGTVMTDAEVVFAIVLYGEKGLLPNGDAIHIEFVD